MARNEEAADVILFPATVDGKDNKVFCIGPFGDKVGFGSQQRRALNLIWALKIKNMITPGKRVAVIGGGLAGLMACLALRGNDCHVDLYEEDEVVLSRQSHTHHRIVHPMINAWPMYNPISSTTANPFFDWHVGICSKVINSLSTEWGRCGDSVLANFHNLSRVTKVMLSGAGVDVTAIKKKQKKDPDEDGTPFTKNYDLVIMATGFGEEQIYTKSDARSYWKMGSIAEARKNKKLKHIAVSGTGDGGLIDCLRLCHRDFNLGALQLKLIADLRKPKHGPFGETGRSAIEDEIRNAELRAKALRRDPRGTTPEEIAADQLAIDNQISEELAKSYKTIVSTFVGRVRTYLDESLLRYERVHLFGLTTQPFSIESSPINKLLIAHLIAEHPTLYKQATIHEEKEELFIEYPDGHIDEFKPDYYVCRHGAKAPITEIIEGFDLEKFKGRQRDIADVLELASFEHDEFTKALTQSRETNPKAYRYLADRTPMAQSYGEEFFQASPKAGRDPVTNEPYFEIIATDEYEASKQNTGGYDVALFGIGVRLIEDVPPGENAVLIGGSA